MTIGQLDVNLRKIGATFKRDAQLMLSYRLAFVLEWLGIAATVVSLWFISKLVPASGALGAHDQLLNVQSYHSLCPSDRRCHRQARRTRAAPCARRACRISRRRRQPRGPVGHAIARCAESDLDASSEKLSKLLAAFGSGSSIARTVRRLRENSRRPVALSDSPLALSDSMMAKSTT